MLHFGSFRTRLSSCEKDVEDSRKEVGGAIRGVRDELAGLNTTIVGVKEDVAYIRGMMDANNNGHSRRFPL